MCGITGIYNYSHKEKINENLLIKMRDEMIHRGPDDFGAWISPDGFVGLAHRRLSIIDLSKAAAQPMCNETGKIWIVFNGEIYNHSEIRQVLLKKNHRFKTDHSDTEMIIHAFEEWGIDCIRQFRGMFAFCIWDDAKKELWIARDRIGIKPLYYTFYNGSFVFASEIKSILVDKKIPRKVNETAFYNYLSFLTSPAPDTMFEGIKKLPAGCYLKIDREGFVHLNKYWDVFESGVDNSKMTEQEIKERILEELKTSVAYRKISDVPVGIFLSGGIDSSVNAMLFSSGNKEKINTFTIGYEGNNQSYLNEFYYARKIAQSIGANHHEKILKVQDFINFLNDLVFYQDEPIGDPVCFPIYHVSKLAKDNGVTVCQVGEGSDELFMGYPNWKIALNLYNLNKIPFMGPVKNFLLKMLKKTGRANRYSYEWLRRAYNNEPIFWGGAEAFFEPEKDQLLSDDLKAKFRDYSSLEAIMPILERFNESAWEKEPLQWMSYLDLNLRLPELLLMRVDKMSMATSLEARVPFLDHKFVEFAMSLSQKQKINRGELKYIFKKSVRGIIPDEILFRKKQGFGVPLYEWFLEELGDFARKKLLGFTKNTEYFNKSYLEELFIKKSANKIWNLLNFVLWHEKWIG